MSPFLEFAVDTFITEAEQENRKPAMIKMLRELPEEELIARIASVMDNLEMAFVMQHGKPLIVHSRVDHSRVVVQELKKRLIPEIASSAAA